MPCVIELKKRLDGYEVIIDQSRGLASAIHKGILQATGETVVVMNCDGTHPPEIIPYMASLVQCYDLVCGSRTQWNFTVQGILSFVGNKIIKTVLHLPVRDCTSSFYAIRKERFLELPNIWYGYGDYYISLLRYASTHGWQIAEVSVAYRPRTIGRSHTRTWKHSVQYLYRTLKCRGGIL